MSLALALGPVCTHRTTKPSRGFCTPTQPQPALPPAIVLQSAVVSWLTLFGLNLTKQEHKMGLKHND